MQARDLADAGEPGKRSGDRGGQQHDAADRDAAMGGGARVGAGGADPKAERGPGDQQPDPDRGKAREQHAEMQPGGAHQRRELRFHADVGRVRIAAERILPGAVEQRHHGIEDDEIEHQRGDHLVHLEADPQHRRHRRRRGPGKRAGEDHGRDQGPAGQALAGADEGCGHGAGEQLAFGADVPEPGAKGDRDREPGEHQRRRLDHGLDEVEAAPDRPRE